MEVRVIQDAEHNQEIKKRSCFEADSATFILQTFRFRI